MKSKRILSLVLAMVMVLGTFGTVFASSNVVAPGQAEDVAAHNYGAAFTKLEALGITQGKTGGLGADLDASLTRAEASKVVLHMLGLQEGIVNNGPTRNEFKDVTSANHWASQYISVAASAGIVQGKGNRMFDPEAPVTENEFVAMIVRALEWGPIVGGNYPYGEYAKALELNIIERASTNVAATRGYAFEVAANGLTAQMAERKATDGNISYEGEGYRNLLNSRLNVGQMNEVVVVTTSRMERDYKVGEFEVMNGSRAEKFIYKGEGFDATEVLGDFVNVWYEVNKVTGENEVVYLEKNVNFRKEVGIVESNRVDTLKLENGRTYNLEGVVRYADNKVGSPKEGYLAAITVNKENKAVFVDAFDITVGSGSNKLELVTSIIEDEIKDNRFVFENQDGNKRSILNEKLIVYKNGKLAEVKDIEKFDLVKGIVMENQARTTFVYVVGEAVEGKVEKVTLDTRNEKDQVIVELGEEAMLTDHLNFLVYGDKEYSDSRDLVEELRGFVKEEVTLVSVAGKVKVLIGEIEPKVVNTALVLDAGIYGRYSDVGSLQILDGANETKDLEFTKNPTSKIYTFKQINSRYTNDGLKLSIYNNVEAGKDAKVSVFYNKDGKAFVNKNVIQDDHRAINLGTVGNLEVKGFNKGTLETPLKTYDIKDSTVIYTLNEDQDKYTAHKYEDLKSSKYSTDMYVHVIEDVDTTNYHTPTADVIVVTQGYFEVPTTTKYGVLAAAARVYKEDKDFVILDVVDEEGKEVQYIAAKDQVLSKSRDAISFELTGKEIDGYKEVKDVKTGNDGKYGVLSLIRGNEYTIDGKVYEGARDGLVRFGFERYDSNENYEVSFVLENNKLKGISLIRTTSKDSVVGIKGIVTYIDATRLELDNSVVHVINADTRFIKGGVTVAMGVNIAGNLSLTEQVIVKDNIITFVSTAADRAQALLIAAATTAVEKAEASKLAADISAAQTLVTGLAAGTAKTDLQNRLNAIVSPLTDLQKATAAVVVAEGTFLQSDVDAAQLLINVLPLGADRLALQNRLDAVIIVAPIVDTGVRAAGAVTTQGVGAVVATPAVVEVKATRTIYSNTLITAKLDGVAGNDIIVEVLQPTGLGATGLSVSVTDKRITVNLPKDAAGAPILVKETDLVAAINANVAASALVTVTGGVAATDAVAVPLIALAGGVNAEDAIPAVIAVAEVYTLTITNGATASGTIELLDGTTSVGTVVVTNGMTADMVATAMAGLTITNYTTTVSGNNVIFTNTAANGNVADLVLTVVNN